MVALVNEKFPVSFRVKQYQVKCLGGKQSKNRGWKFPHYLSFHTVSVCYCTPRKTLGKRRKVMGNEMSQTVTPHLLRSQAVFCGNSAARGLVAGVYKDGQRASRKHIQRLTELFLNARYCSLFQALYRH